MRAFRRSHAARVSVDASADRCLFRNDEVAGLSKRGNRTDVRTFLHPIPNGKHRVPFMLVCSEYFTAYLRVTLWHVEGTLFQPCMLRVRTCFSRRVAGRTLDRTGPV